MLLLSLQVLRSHVHDDIVEIWPLGSFEPHSHDFVYIDLLAFERQLFQNRWLGEELRKLRKTLSHVSAGSHFASGQNLELDLGVQDVEQVATGCDILMLQFLGHDEIQLAHGEHRPVHFLHVVKERHDNLSRDLIHEVRNRGVSARENSRSSGGTTSHVRVPACPHVSASGNRVPRHHVHSTLRHRQQFASFRHRGRPHERGHVALVIDFDDLARPDTDVLCGD